MRLPAQTIATLSGWMGVAFLIGIAGHSFWPSQAVGVTIIAWMTAVAVATIVLGWKKPWLRVLGLCLLALTIALWRFDASLPSMPRGLVPLSPNGLAMSRQYSLITSNKWEPRYWLSRGRIDLTDRAQKIFAPDEAALLTGILYGDRNLSKEAKNNFRRAGLLHIIAVSGSNVTIVSVIVMQFFLMVRLRRRSAFVALSIALVAFVIFVNPSASVVRAAIMGWLIELAPIVGRIPRPSRLLLISAVAFSFWQPWALLFDPSFALSFLAMWGLLTWSPWLNERLKKKLPWTEVRSILCATFGATIMTTPYTAWAFGQVSLWGFATGLGVLPLIPWVMLVGIFSILLPSISFLQWSASGFLKIILWISRWPNVIDFGFWQKLSTPTWMLFTLYIFLYAIWRFAQQEKRVINRKMSGFEEKV